jgi:uncharacterized protein YkwD
MRRGTVREIVTRIVKKSVAITAFAGIATALLACDPAPDPSDCATIKSRYADAAVKDMTPANAERAVFCLTNDERAANGRAPLTSSELLAGTARAHAQDAVARKWWVDGADTHVNPDGKSPSDRIRAAGYCPSPTYWKVAENTYWGWGTPAQTPRDAVEWWMSSYYHRLNILDPDLTELGVGMAKGAPRSGNYPDASVFVQNFGTCR